MSGLLWASQPDPAAPPLGSVVKDLPWLLLSIPGEWRQAPAGILRPPAARGEDRVGGERESEAWAGATEDWRDAAVRDLVWGFYFFTTLFSLSAGRGR